MWRPVETHEQFSSFQNFCSAKLSKENCHGWTGWNKSSHLPSQWAIAKQSSESAKRNQRGWNVQMSKIDFKKNDNVIICNYQYMSIMFNLKFYIKNISSGIKLPSVHVQTNQTTPAAVRLEGALKSWNLVTWYRNLVPCYPWKPSNTWNRHEPAKRI